MYAATSASNAAASIRRAPSRTMSSISDTLDAGVAGVTSGSATTVSMGIPSRPALARGAVTRFLDLDSSGGYPARPSSTGFEHCSDAHLTIVFAALAVSRWIEHRTGWSIRKFVRTARRHRTIQIQAGTHTLTAADPLPDDLRQALTNIHRPDAGAH